MTRRTSWATIRRWSELAVWYVVIGLYCTFVIGATYLGTAFPMLMAVVMVPAALLFAVISVRAHPRLVAASLCLATAQVVIAFVVLSGPGSTWHFGDRSYRVDLEMPEPVMLGLWLVGVALPPATAVWMIRQLRIRRPRPDSAAESAGA